MQTKRGLGLLAVILCAGPLLPQSTKQISQAEGAGTGYRSHAVVAVLPGNPFESRLYSLGRFMTASGAAGPFLRYRREASFEILFQGNDTQKAIAAVKA